MSVSRQLRWQRKRRAAGECVQCSGTVTSGVHCDRCMVLRRGRDRYRERPTPVGTTLCGLCGLPGHNRITCEERWDSGDEDELVVGEPNPEALARRLKLSEAIGKLTKAEVLQARVTYAEGKTTQAALAEELNVTQSSMSLLLIHKSWRHVGGPKKALHTQVIQRQQRHRFLAGVGRVKS